MSLISDLPIGDYSAPFRNDTLRSLLTEVVKMFGLDPDTIYRVKVTRSRIYIYPYALDGKGRKFMRWGRPARSSVLVGKIRR